MKLGENSGGCGQGERKKLEGRDLIITQMLGRNSQINKRAP